MARRIITTPEAAWWKYILPAASDHGWIEDSRSISSEMPLSKRELFALILLAQMYGGKSQNWVVGYDDGDPEPNDGFITDLTVKKSIEHKVIPQMDRREALDAILSTYKKYAKYGKGYGSNRYLVIHANKQSKGLIKIPDLGRSIKKDCPFDKVLLTHCVSVRKSIRIMHITEHHPQKNRIAQVDFDTRTGLADVPHCEIICD